MKKLKFLIVLLAMVSLASCEFREEPILRYEDEISGVDYKLEMFGGSIDAKNKEYFFGDSCVKNPISTSPRRDFIAGLVHITINDDVMYNVRIPQEECSFAMTFEEEICMNKDLYHQFMQDCLNHIGINIDTAYNASYRLVVADNEKFDTICRNSGIVEMFRARVYLNSNEYYSKIAYYKTPDDEYIKLEVVEIDMYRFIVNLRTLHGIPVLLDDDAFTVNEIIRVNKDFYSEPKSVEEVNEMLSEYGLSLEPTGEEMMVITLSVDKPIETPKFFESKSYTSKFFMILLLGVIACVLAVVGISKKEILQPKKITAVRVLLSVLIWLVASIFLLTFFLMFTDMMQQILMESGYSVRLNNAVSLYALSWTLIFVAFGISVLNYRKTYCGIQTEILRIVFSIVIFMLMFMISRSIISGFASINQWSFWLCIVSVMLFVISIRTAKIKTKSDDIIIKLEEDDK